MTTNSVVQLLCPAGLLLFAFALYWEIRRNARRIRLDYPKIDRTSAMLAALAHEMSRRVEGPVTERDVCVLDETMQMLARLGCHNEAQQGWFLNYILREATGTDTDEVPTLEQARDLLAGDLSLTYRVQGMLTQWFALQSA